MLQFLKKKKTVDYSSLACLAISHLGAEQKLSVAGIFIPRSSTSSQAISSSSGWMSGVTTAGG